MPFNTFANYLNALLICSVLLWSEPYPLSRGGRGRVCVFLGQNVAGRTSQVSKHIVQLLHTRSVACTWKLYVATPADAERCFEAAKYNVLKSYLKCVENVFRFGTDVFTF